MKAIFFVLAGILSVASFTSCNKDFTCHCQFTDSSRNFDIKIKDVRKNDAKVLCNDYSQFVGNCAIK